MRDEEYAAKLLDNIIEKEIMRSRESYKNNKKLDDYLFKAFKKIFKKLAFSYFRFEILQRCTMDIKNNNEYYPDMNKKQFRKINIIFNKLQKICLYLNIALDEYDKMITYIEK